jgi:DNA-binding NtrC family response regulator
LIKYISVHEKAELILIIDSDESICEECRQEFSRPGFEVMTAIEMTE